ncbi:hypothetical protein F3Y22_tig00011718pilonHSYRG00097 [Hibiscus syriacus]|uniref:peptidylprolyl isomerase n=1 Tax=Hibiscus syriacus TaxID=106335 RepID=A0A6A3C7K2_HIBSY|nr:hypothetical protein F3Y22_tig00011718pilonHSYRG00097 [Hibiscus syriacus]
MEEACDPIIKVVKKGHDEEPFEFRVDEGGKVVDGLEKTVNTMKKGEHPLIAIQPEYAFGSSESQQELAVVRVHRA